ncbi:MAG: Gfo/Idh/MocA family protein [Puniceicoccaceae bacterium]
MAAIALLGCGVWGMKILEVLISLGSRVVVFDPSPDRRARAKGIGALRVGEVFTHPDGFDGIVLATPASTHCRLLHELAPSGLPIFVEKPLTANLQEAHSLKVFVGKPIYMMHVWMYHPGILKLAELVEEGRIGTLLTMRTIRANWTSPRQDVDSVWNLVPHDLTIAKTILGYIPEPRFAVAECHHGVCREMVGFLGGNPGMWFEVSNRYPDKMRGVRVHGTAGVAVLRSERALSIDLYLGDDLSDRAAIQHLEVGFDPESALELELREFIEFLQGGPAPRSSLIEGIEICETIQRIRSIAGLE